MSEIIQKNHRLFVGGPLHGQFRLVLDNRGVYEVAVSKDASELHFDHPLDAKNYEGGVITYYKLCFSQCGQGRNEEYKLFVCEGTSRPEGRKLLNKIIAKERGSSLGFSEELEVWYYG